MATIFIIVYMKTRFMQPMQKQPGQGMENIDDSGDGDIERNENDTWLWCDHCTIMMER